MDIGIEGRNDGTGHAREDPLGGLQHRHIEAELDRDGGDFETDITRADDGEAGAGADSGPQPLDIGNAAQMMDAGKPGPGQVQAARAGAGRKHQMGKAIGRTVGGRDGPRAGVELPDARRQVQGDARLAIMRFPAQEEPLDRKLAGEKAFRQRRSLIGREALVADQHHLAGKAERAQPQRAFTARLPCSDDDGPVGHDHPFPPALRWR